MGDPSDDDVPTMTSSADLRRDEELSDADADDRTLQKPPDAVGAIEAEAERDRTVMAAAPHVAPPPPPSSVPRPVAPGFPVVSADKLPLPPSTPLRPRMPSSSNLAAPPLPAMRPRPPSKPNIIPESKKPISAKPGKDDEIEGPPTLESQPPPSELQTSPKAQAPPTSKKGPPRPSRPDTEADGEPADDSITATAPRVPAPKFPLAPPTSVEIRTLAEQDDSADETEVKTLAGVVGDVLRAARDNGPPPASAKAPPRVGSAPVIRISQKSVMTPAAGKPRYNAEEEDSVTERGPLGGADYPDDSVTTQSPSAGLHGPIDGETEGTTKRLRKDAAAAEHAADGEQESITAAAPGHLTNMLRVIPSPSDAGDEGELDDEDSLQAHTQVMATAPVNPALLGARRGGAAAAAAAPYLEPTSESGLRVAKDPNAMSGDRASLGLGIPARRPPLTSDAAIGPSGSDGIAPVHYPPMPIPGDAGARPPYVLLVGIVAAISIAIPLLLFIILSQSGPDSAPRVAAQPTPDPIPLAGPRPRTKPNASTSVHRNPLHH